MKIITGTAKGANLLTLEGDVTRPTSQRVKEAIFSMLQFDIEGTVVLDLFAGSGQLGLEALSRGASKAYFCDSSKKATDIIKSNVMKTRLQDSSFVYNTEYSQLIYKLSGKEKFDIVFIDPPYKQRCIEDALKRLLKADLINENAFIVCESGDEDIFCGNKELENTFDVYKQSKYSISYVTILKLSGAKQ